MKKMNRTISMAFVLMFCVGTIVAQKKPVDYVNPFIGTTNFGTTNPGAIVPQGMVSVVPFNVAGTQNNVYDKDSRWWSTPYGWENKFFTGFSHVNLSGVGCPELGVLLLMPTTGEIEPQSKKYGSVLSNQKASPGYYSCELDKYNIKAEATATQRAGITKYTFPEGKGNILLNLGLGLTNEQGASVKIVNDNEVEGYRMTGSFCYNYVGTERPVYFVARFNKKSTDRGVWKKMPKYKAESSWSSVDDSYRLYDNYKADMAGDSIGAYFTFDLGKNETVEVEMGVSYVSIENARENLEAEIGDKTFDQIRTAAVDKWNETLSVASIEGGSDDDKTVFYTSLYHLNIHPNVLQDVNGEYPAMGGFDILKTKGDRDRYTVFSLWDTYRNVHQLLTITNPTMQMDIVNTMLDMYKESGWLPKWEVNSNESLVMEGDPAIPVIVDSYFKGLDDFDESIAYEAMYKSATTDGANNLLRPDNDHYMKKGYVPIESEFDNSVSHALEYYIADWSLAQFAEQLGKTDDYHRFYKQSLGYKNYYDTETGVFRPKLADGTFLKDFDPLQGLNFEPSPGFHEGNAWQYTFYAPHDIKGLAKLMGGDKKFVKKLQYLFDNDYFAMDNEPDINYPYLFSYFKNEEWRTQEQVTRLLKEYFKNSPDGLPGNDDCGTMSAWAAFSMMGFYPTVPGSPEYTFTTPLFDKITLKLDTKYYQHPELVIEKQGNGKYISKIWCDGKVYKGYNISHKDLFDAKHIIIKTSNTK